jgi:hypothetical protein
MFISYKNIVYLILLLVCSNVPGAILNKEEVDKADLNLLQNETTVFKSISMGIALSLAQCEGLDLCSLTVDENEIKQLITTLDDRINTLILKQEEADDPVAFDKVLTAYVNERESYESHLKKLKDITGTTNSESDLLDDSFGIDSEVDDFPVDAAKNEELLDYLNDLEAFDDELEDDEDLEDIPNLPEIP